MFTGVIEKIGTLVERSPGMDGGAKLLVSTGFQDLALGESVAVLGTCLTVSGFQGIPSEGNAFFDLSPETLRCTRFSGLPKGSRLNLERALLPTTRISGHWVLGHVDGMATVLKTENVGGDSHEIQLTLPGGLERYTVTKGSIALDGVSLTINKVDGKNISLMIIPHTWAQTSISEWTPGTLVHVEADILAKYAEKSR